MFFTSGYVQVTLTYQISEKRNIVVNYYFISSLHRVTYQCESHSNELFKANLKECIPIIVLGKPEARKNQFVFCCVGSTDGGKFECHGRGYVSTF